MAWFCRFLSLAFLIFAVHSVFANGICKFSLLTIEQMAQQEAELRKIIQNDEVDLSTLKPLGVKFQAFSARLKKSGLRVLVKDYGIFQPEQEGVGDLDTAAYKISRDFKFHVWPYSTLKRIAGDSPLDQELMRQTAKHQPSLPALKVWKSIMIQPWLHDMKDYSDFTPQDLPIVFSSPGYVRMDLFYWMIGHFDPGNDFVHTNSIHRKADGTLDATQLRFSLTDGEAAFYFSLNPLDASGNLHSNDHYVNGRHSRQPFTRDNYLADKEFYDQFAAMDIEPTIDHVRTKLVLSSKLRSNDQIEAVRKKALWLQKRIREFQKQEAAH